MDLFIRNIISYLYLPFSEMPRYIDHILGPSAKTGRMYFRDSSGASLLSSLDCKHFELTDENADVSGCNGQYCADDITPAINVPGKSQINFPEQTFPNSNIKGTVQYFASTFSKSYNLFVTY